MSKLPPIGSLKINLAPPPTKAPASEASKLPLPPLSKPSVTATLAPLPPVTSTLPPLPMKSPLPSVTSTLPPPPVQSPKFAAPLPVQSPIPIKSPLPKVSSIKIAEAFVPIVPSVAPEIIDTFFGVRNGIMGKPVEGINYDKETLSYMTSKNRADEITNIIVNHMSGDFEIWENTGGIGGNTLSFAENPRVKHVTVYEVNNERRQMLKRNIEMYGLSGKVTNLDKPFTGKDIPAGAVYFADPPWLSTGIKGNESTKGDYVLSGLQIGGKSLEDWIESCEHCALTAHKVPPGYELGPVVNVTVENIQLKNMLLILSSKMESVLARNKRLVMEEKEKERREYLIWREELRNFLRYTMLPRCVSSEDALNKLTNNEAMDIWEIAFTHESFNPTIGANYQVNELYGDAVLEYAFLKFIIGSYPGFTESQLSELKTHYLSKTYQSKLSKSLGLGKFVRTRFPLSIHVYEDVLESFFGALEKIPDQQIKFGVGAGLCFNMVISLYKDIEIKKEEISASTKTRIKERLERLGLINPKLGQNVHEASHFDETTRKTKFTIRLPPKAKEVFKQYGIELQTFIIGQGSDYTKKGASTIAYRNAIDFLDSLGITEEFLAELTRRREMESPELKSYVEGIQERLKLENFTTFYFNEHHVKGEPGSPNTGKYVQLIGVKVDNTKEVLGMTKYPVEDVVKAKQEILFNYKNYIR